MIKQLFSRQKSVILTTLIGLIFIAVLIALPTGYEDALIYKGTERAVGTERLLPQIILPLFHLD